MKTTRLLFMVACLSLYTLTGNAQQLTFSKCLGGSGNDYAHDIKLTSDGGYVVVGYTTSSASGDMDGINHGGKDYWIVKLDAQGNIEWQKNFGGSEDDEAFGIAETTQNEFVVVGGSYSSDGDVADHIGTSEHCDVWIIRLNQNGQMTWGKSLGSEGDEMGIDVELTSQNHILVAGKVTEAGLDIEEVYGLADYWLVNMDLNGNTVWENVYGGAEDDILQDMTITPNDEVYMVGNSRSLSSSQLDREVYMLKIDEYGESIWGMNLGTTLGDNGFAGRLSMDQDGNVLIPYRTSDQQDGINCNELGSFLVRKVSPEGDAQENWCWGGSGSDQAMATAMDANGKIWMMGTTNSEDGDITPPSGYVESGTNIWLAKADSDQNLIWNQSLGGSGSETACSMILNNAQDIVMIGNTLSSDGAVNAQHDTSGLTTDIWITIVSTQATATPELKAIAGVRSYPNPTTDVLNIEVKNTDARWRQLIITDQMGQVVECRLMNALRLTVDTSHLRPGMYTACIAGDDGNAPLVMRFTKL